MKILVTILAIGNAFTFIVLMRSLFLMKNFETELKKLNGESGHKIKNQKNWIQNFREFQKNTQSVESERILSKAEVAFPIFIARFRWFLGFIICTTIVLVIAVV